MNEFEKCAGIIRADSIDTLQVNVGMKCNKSCTHCHLEASPAKEEMMSWDVMQKIIDVTRKHRFMLVDITGGAPELNPHLSRFISEIRQHVGSVQVRTNLTAMLDTDMDQTLREYAKNEVALVASMPCYLEENVDAMRGNGTHASSISILKRLNSIGYGIEDELPVDLVYNPAGAFLPPSQKLLEDDYKRELGDKFGIRFRNLLTISNMPIGRFLKILQTNHEDEEYMKLLIDNYNPSTLEGLMCKKQISVRWDGTLFDCDFNIALDIPLNHGAQNSIDKFSLEKLSERRIMTGIHCFGCTAGSGSSCAGALT